MLKFSYSVDPNLKQFIRLYSISQISPLHDSRQKWVINIIYLHALLSSAVRILVFGLLPHFVCVNTDSFMLSLIALMIEYGLQAIKVVLLT